MCSTTRTEALPPRLDSPEERHGQEPSAQSCVDGVDTEQHLRACGTRQSLADGEDLLILDADASAPDPTRPHTEEDLP